MFIFTMSARCNPYFASKSSGKMASSNVFEHRSPMESASRRATLPVLRADIEKMNIKGVFQVWTKDGAYHEIPLKEAHAWTREGCTTCPDFAAEHADISTGGIGAFNDWTLTIVRTEQGRELLQAMIADGAVETRPGDDDPGAIALLHRLARVSRRRWPETAVEMPGRLPAPT